VYKNKRAVRNKQELGSHLFEREKEVVVLVRILGRANVRVAVHVACCPHIRTSPCGRYS
jgi:hypothetical protein